MAYMNTNNNVSKFNTQNQSTVNTNSIPMYNGDMCLRLSFMNDSISLSFIQAVTRDDGSRTFPKDNAQWCVIKLEYAVLMLNWLNQYFIPMAKANFDKQVADPSVELPPVLIGVPLNRENSNMIVFKYTKPSKDGALVPTITLHSGIGEDRLPTKSVSYEFGIKRIFTEYDEHTGDYAFNMDQVQFWIFLRALNHFVDASTMAEVHANRLGNSYVNREMRNLIRQIAQKNGINTMYNTNGFDSNSGAPTGAITANLSTSENVAGATTLSDMLSVPGDSELPF